MRQLTLTLVFSIGLLACNTNEPSGAINSQSGGTTTPKGALSSVPAPSVSGPISGGLRGGRPWGGADERLAPLADFDFVQEEYFFSGLAQSRNVSGDNTGSEAAYTTRMLVQRPRLPENFNGTVFVEWFNVTSEMELSILWSLNYAELLREGYAYVGLSAQEVGVSASPLAIQIWDPIRYAPLNHPGDVYAYDIVSQAGRSLFEREGPAPLGELQAQRVIMAGESQSAALLIPYANKVHAEHQVFDGFYIHTYPGPISAEVDVPVMMILTEAEMDGLTSPDGFTSNGGSEYQEAIGEIPGLGIVRLPASQPASADANNLRVWELAGGSHYDRQALYYSFNAVGRDMSAPISQPGDFELPYLCAKPINQLAMQRPSRAALHSLNDWIKTGLTPPSQARVSRDENGGILRDELGLAVGGIQVPSMMAPVGLNTGHDCILFGSYTPFSSDQALQLYPNKEDYLSAVEQAAAYNIEQGWLLPPEAQAYVTDAETLDLW